MPSKQGEPLSSPATARTWCVSPQLSPRSGSTRSETDARFAAPLHEVKWMRLAELSTVTLTLLAAGGLPWLFACASAPPAVPPAASTGGAEAGAGAAAGSPAEADVH